MRIKKFNEFDILDSISESRVYFLDDLSNKLRRMCYDTDDYWAGKLLRAQGKNIDSDTTFLNLDGENFSFSKEADIKKAYSELSDKLFNDEEEYHSIGNYLGNIEQNNINGFSNRGKVKMGKVIKKLIPEINDRELEKMVNSLKSETSGYKVILVKGDDIKEYYKRENCDSSLLDYGTLDNSCMMDKVNKKPHIFDIYTKNPEVCQLAVMLNDKGELVARALVWKITELQRRSSDDDFYKDEFWENIPGYVEKGKYFKVDNLLFMDRIYYTKDWMSNYLQQWAIKNGMMFKLNSSFIYKGNHCYPLINVKVNKIGYRNFPYLDTLNYYQVKESILSNGRIGREFSLNSTRGSYDSLGNVKQVISDRATNYIRRFKDYLK